MMSETSGKPNRILAPGGTIGILGGGQLGRMLAAAGTRLGLNTHIYSPQADCPAAVVAQQCFVGEFDDVERILAFAETCDAVTYEFENVPAMTASGSVSCALTSRCTCAGCQSGPFSREVILESAIGIRCCRI